MATNSSSTHFLTKFKQQLMDGFVDSITGPVTSLVVHAGGVGYQNTDSVVFTQNVGDPNPANAAIGKITTDANGIITSATVVSGGSYSITPAVTVTSNTGSNAVLNAVLDTDTYYLFVARTLPYANGDTSVEPVTESDYSGFRFEWDQMIFGAKIDTTDVSALIPIVPWVSNTVYSEYSDMNANLASGAEHFYVLNSANAVFKCIFNNNDSPSTVMPSNTAPLAQATTLSDGYRWMYMYQITSDEAKQFATNNFIPVFANSAVVAGTLAGSIQNVQVLNAGVDYPYANGTIVAANNGSFLLLSSPVSVIPNYYANSMLTVFGASNLVTNFPIIGSSTNNGVQQIKISGSFNANQISAGYSYQIAPTLKVVGDGIGFSGYFTMNPGSGSIIDVNIIATGNSYNYANAYAVSSASFGSNAELSVVISPPGGHGTDPRSELYSSVMGITGKFSNTDTKFQNDLTFRTIGILKNPFAYSTANLYMGTSFSQLVTLGVANQSATLFSIGERVFGQSSGAKICVVSANTSSLVCTGFNGELEAGEDLLGETSGAVYTLNNVGNTTPDLEMYTGEILYLNNISPATHASSNSELIKIAVQL